MAGKRKPKILLAPMNIASMPIQVVNALKKEGYEAEQLSYTAGEGHKFGYEMDVEYSVKEHGGRIETHGLALKESLQKDFDIYHFWNKSLFYESQYNVLTGLDLPLIKSRGKRIAYRFTGYDLRLPSWDKEVNQYSPFHYGYEHIYNEDIQKQYLEFLEEYVDQFLVQDPEMAQFAPKGTKIIPRAMELTNWDFVGVSPTDYPLVVHAPSNKAVKGTRYIMRAVRELQDEGLKFEFKLISGMTNSDAKELYKKSDIVIDQIMIGATGVLTLEAWALGKPCVVFLREDLFKDFYKCNELPIVNANPDTIKSQLRDLIKDYEKRKHLSVAGRALVEKFHDSDKVVKQYIKMYNSMMRKKPVVPTGTKDVDYLKLQATLSQKSLIKANVLTRKLGAANLAIKDYKNGIVPSKELLNDVKMSPDKSETLKTSSIPKNISAYTPQELLEIYDLTLPKVISKPIRFGYKVKKFFKSS